MSSSELQRRRGSAAETFLVAALGALLAAAWYVGSAGYRFAFRNEIVNVSRDIAWMGPAATLFFFLLLAIPVALVARLVTRAVAIRLAFGVFAGLAIFSMLLPYPAIATVASIMLSIGIGVAASRAAARWPAASLRVARIATVLLVVAFLIASAVLTGGAQLATRRAIRELPAAAPGSPNVLLIVLDAVRASAFSSYGYARRATPHFDSLAREGVLFETALSVAPWTLPSHHSMLSGEYQPPGARASHFLLRPPDDGTPVLPELLRARGYETAGFVANLFYTAWDSELDRGFIHYSDYPRTIEQTLRSSAIGQTQMVKRFYSKISLANVARLALRPDFYINPKPANSIKSAVEETDQFLSWLAGRENRPFFVLMNYFDAHDPYQPPPPFDHAFAAKPTERDLYDGAVLYMDSQINRILTELRRRKLLDNTLVIITADHGELFGEHGLTGHHSSLYYPVLHVPLIMRYPKRIPAGVRVAEPVTLRDLAATIADVTGIRGRPSLPGVSLAGHWTNSVVQGSPLFASVEKGVRVDSTLPFAKGDMVSLTDRDWHYIRNTGTGKEELFRYRGDPDEKNDSAAAPGSAPVLRRLRARTADLSHSRVSAGLFSPRSR